MANLATYLQSQKDQSNTRLSFVKTAKQLALPEVASLRSGAFHYLNVETKKFPLIFAEGAKQDGPLILDSNFGRIGKLECGYVPSVIVLSGIDAAKKSKKEFRARAWIGVRALRDMQISAADVSCNDLQGLLSRALRNKYGKKSKNGALADYTDCPYVNDLYPFQNYAIVGFKGETYRQNFKFDANTRVLDIDGDLIPVVASYNTVPETKVDDVKAMSLSQMLYDKPNGAAPALGGFNGPLLHQVGNLNNGGHDIVNYGAPGSEANNPMLKLMLNVEEALRMYTEEIATGIHRVVYPANNATPPNNMLYAARETSIALKSAGIDKKTFALIDFFRWQHRKLTVNANAQTKLVSGEMRVPSEFAYVGEKTDPSTWFVPIKTSGEIFAAARCSHFAGVPKKSLPRVMRIVKDAAIAAKGSPSSGSARPNEMHKFAGAKAFNAKCKVCGRGASHPIHSATPNFKRFNPVKK